MGVGVKVDKGRMGFRAESGVIHPGAVEARIMVLRVSLNPMAQGGQFSLHSIFGEFRFSLHADTDFFLVFHPNSSPLGSIGRRKESCSLYQY